MRGFRDGDGVGADGGGALAAALAVEIVEAAPVIVVVLDRAGHVLHVNPFFEALSGRRLADLRGADWFEHSLPRRDRERVRGHFEAAINGELVSGKIIPIITASGQERMIEWHCRALRGPDGVSSSLVCIGKDVTEQLAAAEALRTSEANLREAQRLAHVGSWELDLVSGVLRWSDEIYRIFELDRAAFGASYEAFLAVVHPDDRARIDATYRESLVTRRSYAATHRLLLPNGRVKHVHQRCQTHYAPDGAPLRSLGTVQDVTAEHAAQLRLRRIMDAMGPFVGVLDLEGRLVEANQRPLDASGAVDPEARRRPLWELYHLTHAPEVQSAIRTAFARAAAGEVTRRDVSIRLGPGRFATFEGMLGPLLDEVGRVEAVICTGVDVSERIRLEEELRTHSQVLLRMGEGVHFTDGQGIIRYANQALERMFGYAPRELVGRPVTVLNDADEAENAALVAEIMGAMATTRRWEGTIRNRRRDGTTFYTRTRITRVDEPSEELYVCVQEDVTERLAAEATVRQTRDLLRQVIDASPDWIYVKDLDGRFLVINEAMTRALEAAPDAVLRRIEAEGGGLPARRTYADERRAVGGAEVRNPSLRIEGEDGAAARVFDALISPLKGVEGEVYAVLGRLRDVTRERAADEELRRSLAEKETLLREIHHRVKNNLQVISSLLHFHAMRVRAPEDLAAFVGARRRLMAMLLVHEQLYRSTSLSRIDVAAYLRDLTATLASSLRCEAKVSVAVAVEAASLLLPVEVALPCGMIVCELVTNIFKYASPDGRAVRASVRAGLAGGRVRIVVEDDGVGLPAGSEPDARSAFGWSLVRTLVLQLDGDWQIEGDGGVRVSISFKAPDGCVGGP